MTTTPDPLLARCTRLLDALDDMTTHEEIAAAVLRIARPAIVEECAKVCEQDASGGDGIGFSVLRVRIARRIRALADGDKAGET